MAREPRDRRNRSTELVECSSLGSAKMRLLRCARKDGRLWLRLATTLRVGLPRPPLVARNGVSVTTFGAFAMGTLMMTASSVLPL